MPRAPLRKRNARPCGSHTQTGAGQRLGRAKAYLSAEQPRPPTAGQPVRSAPPGQPGASRPRNVRHESARGAWARLLDHAPATPPATPPARATTEKPGPPRSLEGTARFLGGLGSTGSARPARSQCGFDAAVAAACRARNRLSVWEARSADRKSSGGEGGEDSGKSQPYASQRETVLRGRRAI